MISHRRNSSQHPNYKSCLTVLLAGPACPPRGPGGASLGVSKAGRHANVVREYEYSNYVIEALLLLAASSVTESSKFQNTALT